MLVREAAIRSFGSSVVQDFPVVFPKPELHHSAVEGGTIFFVVRGVNHSLLFLRSLLRFHRRLEFLFPQPRDQNSLPAEELDELLVAVGHHEDDFAKAAGLQKVDGGRVMSISVGSVAGNRLT